MGTAAPTLVLRLLALAALGARAMEVVPQVTDCGAVDGCASAGDGYNDLCYFDTASLDCVACSRATSDPAQEPLLVADYGYLGPYGNPLRCRCAPGYASVAQDCSDNMMEEGECLDFECVSCGAGEAPYADDSACASCGATTSGLDGATEDCACAGAGDVLCVRARTTTTTTNTTTNTTNTTMTQY